MTMASVFSIVGGAIWSLCKADGNCRQVLSYQPRVTVTSCFVYNVIRDLITDKSLVY